MTRLRFARARFFEHPEHSYLSEASEEVALGFPPLVFYLETKDCIDIWRVLHTARDIPAWMQESITAAE